MGNAETAANGLNGLAGENMGKGYPLCLYFGKGRAKTAEIDWYFKNLQKKCQKVGYFSVNSIRFGLKYVYGLYLKCWTISTADTVSLRAPWKEI